MVLYHDQLRAAGQKPTVSDARRARSDAPYRWRRRARCDEVQPREIPLALPPLPAYAGSSPRDHCVPARTGNGNNHRELEKVRRRKTWRGLATRFFRSPLARPSRTGRENQLHPDESGPQRIVPATGGLGVGLSSERSPAAALVGRAVLCAPNGIHKQRRAPIRLRSGQAVTRPTKHSRVGRAGPEASGHAAARTGVRALPFALTNTLIRRSRVSACLCCNFRALLRR